ncbi:MAG: outer membrane beta-barrel protein [Bacteroidota bacterium]
MMKLNFRITLFFLIIALSANAQKGTFKKGFSVFSNSSYRNISINIDNPNINNATLKSSLNTLYVSKLSIGAEFVGEYFFKDNWSVQAGLNYLNKGWRLNPYYTFGVPFNTNSNFHSILVPVVLNNYLKLGKGEKLFLKSSAGFSADYIFKNNAHGGLSTFNKFGFSGIVACGLNLRLKNGNDVALQPQWIYGLSNLNADNNFIQYHFSNIGIKTSYSF